MLFFPYENIVLNTSLSSEQVLERLRGAVDTSKPTWSSKWLRGISRDSLKPFEGSIDGFNFKINRIIIYRNSFLPIIIGKIEGSKIEITLRTAVFVTIFMIFWLSATGSVFIYTLSEHNKGWIQAGLMFLFGFLLWLIAFKIEAEIAKKKLKEILGLGSMG